MADTPLPSIATVNAAQLATMLEVYGDVETWKQKMIQHIINDIKRHKQAEVQVIYQQRLQELNQQESDAMAAIDTQLANLVSGV
jgi:hypothetical protein